MIKVVAVWTLGIVKKVIEADLLLYFSINLLEVNVLVFF